MTDSMPAGRYVADTDHSSVIFRIKHLGIAWYTARFNRFSASLAFDPTAPETMRLDAEVELASIDTAYSGSHGDWDKDLARREDLLGAARNPHARFTTTAVHRTGDTTADVKGDLSLRGVTQPMIFASTDNGGLLKDQFDRTLVGFSAHAKIKRSEFGLTFFLGPLLPDDVELIIELEMALAR